MEEFQTIFYFYDYYTVEIPNLHLHFKNISNNLQKYFCYHPHANKNSRLCFSSTIKKNFGINISL